MTAPAVFVAGTDTGVGKTQVASSLCRELRERGLRVGVFKPVETGCPDPDRPADALALKEASGCDEPLDRICPYRLRSPLAPAIAARREGVLIDLAVIDRCLAEIRRASDVVVAEGAGGLLVPLGEAALTADWLERQGLPVLLVGRLGLGTINHTLLSARYLQSRQIQFVGTVLSAGEAASGLAEETNPAVLASFPEVRLLGVLPHAPRPILPREVVEAIAGLCRCPRIGGGSVGCDGPALRQTHREEPKTWEHKGPCD
jgi:dethiobiotin synthetase